MDTLQFSDQPFESNDEISFLSNFYATKIKYKNSTYTSVEQAYRTLQCKNESDVHKIANIFSRKKLKIISRFIESECDWDESRKIEIMLKILKKKFNKLKMRKKLAETRDLKLVYINYAHEMFWGVCTCTKHKRKGRNILGKLLMKMRFLYRQLDHIIPNFEIEK